MPDYIHHITLTTGYTRRSYRSEVDASLMAPLQTLLSEALAAGRDGVAILDTGCTMTCAAQGRCLGISVFGPPVEDMPALIAYIGIAPRARCGATLWRGMHHYFGSGMVETIPDSLPPAPWCGAVLHVGAQLYPDTMDWLGDYERCMAWAWLERQ